MPRALRRYQDPQTGLWYNVVDKPDRPGNWLESSASSMYIYIISKTVQRGYVPRKYSTVACKGYHGMLTQLIATPEALGLEARIRSTRFAGRNLAVCVALVLSLPEQHPMISSEELSMLQGEQRDSGTHQSKERVPLKALLCLRETWGVIAARSLTDPVWFFITDWFPIDLVTKGFSLSSSLLAVWVPFLAADAGSYVGGLLSGWLVRRGWPLLLARKAIVLAGGLGTLCLIPTIFVGNLLAITALFAIATFSYQAFSVMANVLPSDLYQPQAVATVSGLAGTVAGIGTILGYKAIGYFSDTRSATGTHAFDPIMVVCGLVPFVGALLVLWLIRPQRSSSSALKSV